MTNATKQRISPRAALQRPTQDDAEKAVRTLLAWAGDDPSRAELLDTPKRVALAYREYFSGYGQDAGMELAETFTPASAYNDIVLLKDIPFDSHCEHHIAPFGGLAHVAYLPGRKLAGLSKIGRVVDILARRLQTQEALTSMIAQTIAEKLDARGVAVMMSAKHQCVAMRGLRQQGVTTVTSQYTGVFEHDAIWRDRFLAMVHARRPI